MMQKIFIIITLARWDNVYSSTAISFSKELAKTNKVFLIDNPFTWKDFITMSNKKQLKKRWRALLFGINSILSLGEDYYNLNVIIPPLIFPINWMNNGKAYRFFFKLNNWIVNKAIKKAIKRYKLKDYILINIFNPYYHLDTNYRYPPNKYIYYTVDNIKAAKYLKKHGPLHEINSIKQADLVCSTSLKLKEYAQQYNNNVILLPNAVNYKLFNNSSKYYFPEELKNSKNDLLGYIGNLDNRIDYQLLMNTLNKLTNVSLLLVGPINTKSLTLKRLLTHPRVIYTGSKSIDEIPSYLNQINCALIPFLNNEFTNYIYPLKVNEYLAVGLPVVSTNFSPDIQLFEEVIYISSNEDDYINSIQKALIEDKAKFIKIRSKIAQNNSWENRIVYFLKHCIE